MKFLITIILGLLLPNLSIAQNALYDTPTKQYADSVKFLLATAEDDTLKMSIYRDLALYYEQQNFQTAISYAHKGLVLSKKLEQKLWESAFFLSISYDTLQLGNYSESQKALNYALEIIKNIETEKNIWHVEKFSKDGDAGRARMYMLAKTHLQFALLHGITENSNSASISYGNAISTSKSVHDKVGLIAVYANLCGLYEKSNLLDTALAVGNKTLAYLDTLYLESPGSFIYKFYKGITLKNIGLIYLDKNIYDSAMIYLMDARQFCQDENTRGVLVNCNLSLSQFYLSLFQYDSALFYAKEGLNASRLLGSNKSMFNAYNKIASILELQDKTGSAMNYLDSAKVLGESLSDTRKKQIDEYQTNNTDRQNALYKFLINLSILVQWIGLIIILWIILLVYGNINTNKIRNENIAD